MSESVARMGQLAVRDVFEDEDPFPGLRELHVVSSDGLRAVEVKIIDSWLEEGLVQYLRTLLDKKDPLRDTAQRTLGLQLVR